MYKGLVKGGEAYLYQQREKLGCCLCPVSLVAVRPGLLAESRGQQTPVTSVLWRACPTTGPTCAAEVRAEALAALCNTPARDLVAALGRCFPRAHHGTKTAHSAHQGDRPLPQGRAQRPGPSWPFCAGGPWAVSACVWGPFAGRHPPRAPLSPRRPMRCHHCMFTCTSASLASAGGQASSTLQSPVGGILVQAIPRSPLAELRHRRPRGQSLIACCIEGVTQQRR